MARLNSSKNTQNNTKIFKYAQNMLKIAPKTAKKWQKGLCPKTAQFHFRLLQS
jgi:hypothetical protein